MRWELYLTNGDAIFLNAEVDLGTRKKSYIKKRLKNALLKRHGDAANSLEIKDFVQV